MHRRSVAPSLHGAAKIISMSAQLNMARTLLKQVNKSTGRKPEFQIRDLCKVLQNVIGHIETVEKKTKKSAASAKTSE